MKYECHTDRFMRKLCFIYKHLLMLRKKERKKEKKETKKTKLRKRKEKKKDKRKYNLCT